MLTTPGGTTPRGEIEGTVAFYFPIDFYYDQARMPDSYLNKVLQAKLEFRDLSYIFVLVIEEHEDHLIAVQLPEHTTPDSKYAPPLYDMGTSCPHIPSGWKEERGKDAKFRLILHRTVNGIEDDIQRIYEPWDGLPKPYRYV